MKATSTKPKTVEAYIAAAPAAAQAKLRQMRTLVRAAAPGAVESIKWRMPAFSYRRILVMFSAFKHHLGFYPTAAAMKQFAPELAKFKTGRGSIQFPLDQPLPAALIRKLTAARVRDSNEKDGKWRTKNKVTKRSPRS
ncbi:MAG TPA: DUF1801 domain-containing protein [Candidatus Acidoferrales bacterium]